ncbi:MAG: indolepyruvate ferredoxin oxidoreductase, beta subunit [Moorella sp. (in: firmicutes)]|jgi:indolepyruvate ferredoxin oxidoreductase beta subunit|nr:indolepyruvate ferredoxin oxidoreductase, beta subunit [Moorella sp. (in: firmicutes)]MDK2894201.1 indolepyruvate ferredoxin oxidoreductase, beta subunit [Moorella sp. (in: firmicutes)]
MDILIAGVGGQGIILASRALASAAVTAGLPVRTAETIGMAQREGSVVSHVRLGVQEAGPLIPAGAADILLALEPAEACRNLKYLRPGGKALVSTAPVIPVLAALGSSPYPLDDILAYLQDNLPGCRCLDALALAREAGSPRTLNLVMLGCLVNFGLPFPADVLLAEALKLLPASVHDMNRRAFELGRRALEV